MSKKRIAFTVFLLIGQGAFLLATIEHIAYFFSAFDRISYIIPYGIAISIDGFIALMSYAIIDMRNHNIVWHKILPISVVVAILSLLSIYINGVYNRHFEVASMLSGVDTISIPVFGDVNSLIASCFSFLILAYTFVGDALSSTVIGETLEQKATRLENERAARERIAQATKGSFTDKIKGAISGTVDVIDHATHSFSHKDQTDSGNLVTIIGGTKTLTSNDTMPEEIGTEPAKAENDGEMISADQPRYSTASIHQIEQAVVLKPRSRRNSSNGHNSDLNKVSDSKKWENVTAFPGNTQQ